jgi:hypothetical protein
LFAVVAEIPRPLREQAEQNMPVLDQPPAIIEIVHIEYDRGGNLGEYLARFQGYRDQGAHVQVEGVCGSGCTLVTILPEKNVCVTTHARLVFHQANDLASGAPNWLATKGLMDQYPYWVRAWIASTGRRVLGPELMVMGTAELKKHYADCVSNDAVARQ